MNLKAFVAFAEKKNGEQFLTAGERTQFSVEVGESRLEFTIASGRRRQESFPYVEMFCRYFKERQSLRPVDYPETRNASYLIGLAREFRKPRRA